MSEPRRIAIVMSRMPRLIDPGSNWLRGLRAGLRRIYDRQQILLVSPGTAGSDFVVRGAARIGIPMESPTDTAVVDSTAGRFALRDQQLIAQADEVLVLSIRPRGNIHRLLLERLQTPDQGIVLVDLPDLQPPPVRESLLSQGAELWSPDPECRRPFVDSVDTPGCLERTDTSGQRELVLSLAPLPRDDLVPYLTHTTRACPGPWPQQTSEDYLDSVLDDRLGASHSAFHTLQRIVMQRRLIGSGRTIRGGYPVVSFTAAPVRELPGLRCFRTHRAHWDFEPYAISIRRDVLERRGVLPAIYGGESVWNDLTESQRPFFQFRGSPADVAGGTRSHDWSIEREWRHLGDLDLSDLQPDELTVLVPNAEAARCLQPYSPWPLTLWPAASEIG